MQRDGVLRRARRPTNNSQFNCQHSCERPGEWLLSRKFGVSCLRVARRCSCFLFFFLQPGLAAGQVQSIRLVASRLACGDRRLHRRLQPVHDVHGHGHRYNDASAVAHLRWGGRARLLFARAGHRRRNQYTVATIKMLWLHGLVTGASINILLLQSTSHPHLVLRLRRRRRTFRAV